MQNRFLLRLAFMACCLALFSCNSKKQVDMLVINATIYTVDSSFTIAEAMAIKDGKILATGTSADLTSAYSAAETIDATGKFIFPGFIDAHCHFFSYGKGLNECDFTGTKSWREIIERVRSFAATHPTGWLIGRGWDQNDWPVTGFPSNDSLNTIFPDRPVILTRIDGHAAIANQKALDISSVKAGQTLTGGAIETLNGKLTGLLIDNATELVESHIPAASENDMARWLKDAEKNCVAVGLTSVQDCGLDAEQVSLIKKLHNSNSLQMRLYVMLSDKKENYDWAFSNGKIKTDRLSVCGFKLYADGALGSRGACLLKSYSDLPGHYGFLLKNKSYYDSILPIIAKHEWQACTHAIGDSANRTILQLYKSVLLHKGDLRWRIEHAQVIDKNDFSLFAESRVIPSVQPTHATSDMYWAGLRLGGERVKTGYAYQQLLQQNGWIPLGTDFPVEDIDPLKTFYAAVVRKDAKGFPDSGFQMENALTSEQAIRGMTIWAAKAAFEEKEKGSLEKGKYADFIILDKNIMKESDEDLLKTKVLATVIGGKTVYKTKD